MIDRPPTIVDDGYEDDDVDDGDDEYDDRNSIWFAGLEIGRATYPRRPVDSRRKALRVHIGNIWESNLESILWNPRFIREILVRCVCHL